jgi:hypothetical protein
MIASKPTSPDGRPAVGSGPEPEVRESPVASSDRPVTTLRGAGVDVDPRRARQLVLAACLVALAVTAVILLVAGIQKNAQANRLQHHGVAVAVTVTGCSGLLGGSGSNGAGYACKGTYSFDGRRYEQSIPGNGLHQAGSVVRGVIVADDPGLLSTPGMIARQPASWSVFIVPAVLFGVLAVALVAVAVVRRRGGHPPDAPAPR